MSIRRAFFSASVRRLQRRPLVLRDRPSQHVRKGQSRRCIVGRDNGAQSLVPTKPLRQAQMSRYRRLMIEGGAFFFTLALAVRGSTRLVRHIERRRRAYSEVVKRPSVRDRRICSCLITSDTLWTAAGRRRRLRSRWSLRKSDFARGLVRREHGRSGSYSNRAQAFGIAAIGSTPCRGDADLAQILVGSVHYNAGETRPGDGVGRRWPFSTFQRYVAQGILRRRLGGRRD